ncbi:MAG: FliA/WhiG family RNA polymerase sigma factor [Deltaproteobacteria bacterium]|nr:FliA/WhiG family RNA polymerase sigma factor [Deltaproteobacteria bacterium]MBW2139393.1 FliA/WhiG family RNA polymerase sigma factor [Deltaproteobacteria bacterium]
MKAGISKYQESFDIEQAKKDARLREDLILRHAPLVKQITERMAIRLPSHVSKEDLVSAGIVGLLDALDKFDPEIGVKFQTYAGHRIRGAILDELRKMDWVSRTVRKEIHNIEAAINKLRSKLGREPEDFEVAKELGVDIGSYQKMIARAQGAGLLSIDMTMPDGSSQHFGMKTSSTPSPFDELKRKELKGIISKALSRLSRNEQLVMSLYYYEELTLKEIAEIMGLTESRICQIHSKVILSLRARLRSYFEGNL